MKAVLALAASLSLASASLLPRQLDQIPNCALQCALGSLQSTGCQTTDFACICSANAFVSALVPCVQGACSAEEFAATVEAARGLCAAAGVTLSVPGGAPETTTMASSAPPTSTEMSSSMMTSEMSSEMSSSMMSSEMMSSTMSSEMMTSTGMPASSSMPANGTQSSTRPPSPTGTEPGAAGRNTVALGGLGAVVALVAAFL